MTLHKVTNTDSHMDMLGRAGKHYILKRGIVTQVWYQNPLSSVRDGVAATAFEPTDMKTVVLTVSPLVFSWIKTFQKSFLAIC